MNKICVIGVYFGKLPNYFPLWLKSAKSNKNVDFYIFTDCDLESEDNVTFNKIDLFGFKKLVEDKLGFPVSLDRPYKCCDYKPVYGIIFKDYISKYEYWGHCDFDLIFGDIEKFTQKYNLTSYDRFLTLGHLSLYRNTEEVNSRYKIDNSKMSYKEVFTSSKSFAFDEVCGMTKTYIENGWALFSKLIFADIASVHKRYKLIEIYPLDKKPKNYKKQVFYWENGKTYRTYISGGQKFTEEYVYIHFKKRPNFTFAFDLDKTNAFYITNKGFFAKYGEVTDRDIDLYNKHKGFLYETFEMVKFKTSSLFEKVKRRISRR